MLRREFVRRVSTEILTQLIEALVSDAILDDLEKESIIEENKSRANKARCFVDTVRKKGSKACRIMINHLRKLDPVLFSELHRSSSVKKGEATHLCNKGLFTHAHVNLIIIFLFVCILIFLKCVFRTVTNQVLYTLSSVLPL